MGFWDDGVLRSLTNCFRKDLLSRCSHILRLLLGSVPGPPSADYKGGREGRQAAKRGGDGGAVSVDREPRWMR